VGEDFYYFMKFALVFPLILLTSLSANTTPITQAKFFRLLGIKPTESESAPFGGLNVVVKVHRALAKNQTKLEFEDEGIKDLKVFEMLVDLEWLRLSHNPISDLKPLSNLTKLQVLSLYGVPYKRDKLEKIKDLGPLAELQNLWSLALDEHQISDLSPLANLTNLKDLYLTNNEISNVDKLARLSSLKSLFLSNNRISDISPLSNLKELEWLRLSSNLITSLWPLANHSKLEQLFIDNNKIINLAPIARLTQLKELRVANNQIKNLGSLSNFTNLIFSVKK